MARGFPRTSAVLADYMATGRPAGASLAIQNGLAAAEYVNVGRLAFGVDATADQDTIFRIYSMTKPATGVGCLPDLGGSPACGLRGPGCLS
ncbi:MAG: hypothetical protein JWR47_829 [Phenylobacterium sp.]|nr:hypothetical protein [Phenylobacterium sp.]